MSLIVDGWLLDWMLRFQSFSKIFRQLVGDRTDQKAILGYWTDKSRRQSAQYGYFTVDNDVCWALANSVKVTATEFFFPNSSMYIEIDTCVETGKMRHWSPEWYYLLKYLVSYFVDETRLIRRQWAVKPVPTRLYRFLQHHTTCMRYLMDISRRWSTR